MSRIVNDQTAGVMHEQGLRVTPQRRAVGAAFEDGRAGHLTADEVLRRARRVIPEGSRATVYNALAEFVAAGLLSAIEGTGSQLYDANVAPHHHLRCRVCRHLFDVHPEGTDRLALAEPGYIVERASVVFEGTRPSCAADRPTPGAGRIRVEPSGSATAFAAIAVLGLVFFPSVKLVWIVLLIFAVAAVPQGIALTRAARRRK